MTFLLIIFVTVFELSAGQDAARKGNDISPLRYPWALIISGKSAALEQFPWHVALTLTQRGRYFCGGSLISAEWVLSAAHCFQKISEVLMIFGAVHVNQPETKLTSSEIIIHPEYNAANLNNDIALIRLPTPVEFTTNIKPISLISRSLAKEEFIGRKPLVAGFGCISDEELGSSKILLFTEMEIRPKEDCIKLYGENKFKPSTICAQGPGDTNQNICHTDSGGAMVLDIDGEKMQFGIISFVVVVYQCTSKKPSGFLRVGSYLDYIEQITGIFESNSVGNRPVERPKKRWGDNVRESPAKNWSEVATDRGLQKEEIEEGRTRLDWYAIPLYALFVLFIVIYMLLFLYSYFTRER